MGDTMVTILGYTVQHTLPFIYKNCHISFTFQNQNKFVLICLEAPTDKGWKKVQIHLYSCPPLELHWNSGSIHTPEILGKGKGKRGDNKDFWASV